MYPLTVESAGDAETEPPATKVDEPRRLRSAAEPIIGPERRVAGSGSGPGDAGRIVDALKSTADQEMTIAERLCGKARQAFTLGAGVFVVAQTVAFNSFDERTLDGHEKVWMLRLAILAVAILGLAAFATVKADGTVDSRDLPLKDLESDLNAAYEGDADVLGRLGGYYLGVVRSRREGNVVRRRWYKRARFAVALSLMATVAELLVSIAFRIS